MNKILNRSRRNPLAPALLLLAAMGAGPGLADTPDPSGDQPVETRQIAPRSPLTLDILTFNTFLRPFVPDQQDRRAPLMAGQLKGHDVVLLQEVFSDWHRDLLLDGLAGDYPHRTRVLGRDHWFRQDGGVMIISRWPIELEFQRRFGDLCNGKDCLADKGVIYARIRKGEHRFHVFATHLQSGKANGALRAQQLAAVRQLIDSMALPAGEPVLIGGDLNVDLHGDARDGAFSRMTHTLNASHPAAPAGQRQRSTLEPSYTDSADGRYLDYLLYSRAHLRPRFATTTARSLAADGRPLSDHLAVHGHFAFDAPVRRGAGGFAFVELFDGPDSNRDFICNIALPRDSRITLTGNAACDHARARAFRLHDVPAGRVIRFLGQNGGTDWIEVTTKRFVSSLDVSSLDARLDNEDVLITGARDGRFKGAIAGIEDITARATARLAP